MKLIRRVLGRYDVLCIFPDSSKKVVPVQQAFDEAQRQGLDLVEVSAQGTLTVCKIVDYGKLKFEESKKQKRQQKNSAIVVVKELKFRPNSDSHDVDTKVRQMVGFLEEGKKVKVSVQFRGREIVHPEVGQALLQQVFQRVSYVATLERAPLMEGRNMWMLCGPKPIVTAQKKAP